MIGKHKIHIAAVKGPGIMLMLMLLFSCAAYGQEPPPRPLEITETQQLSFGVFTILGAGGTVIIDADGTRSATGNVYPLTMLPSHSTARFELIAIPGTIISLMGWPASVLTNGTQTMSFTINSALPLLPFVINTIPPAGTTLNLGGTLNVGSIIANPSGNYSGTYNVTFVQE